MEMENKIRDAVRKADSIVKYPKEISKVKTLKKAPIKQKMIRPGTPAIGMVPTPSLHIPPPKKNTKNKL